MTKNLEVSVFLELLQSMDKIYDIVKEAENKNLLKVYSTSLPELNPFEELLDSRIEVFNDDSDEDHFHLRSIDCPNLSFYIDKINRPSRSRNPQELLETNKIFHLHFSQKMFFSYVENEWLIRITNEWGSHISYLPEEINENLSNDVNEWTEEDFTLMRFSI